MSIKGTLRRLRVLRLTTSHTQYYKKMDEFGGNFNKIIKSAVEKDSNFLLVRQSQMETPQTLAVTASDEPNLALSGQEQGYTQCDTDNQLTEHPTTVGCSVWVSCAQQGIMYWVSCARDVLGRRRKGIKTIVVIELNL